MLEVLLNGGFITCSALLAASSVQIWLGRQRVRDRLQELEELRLKEQVRQQRIIELSRTNAAREFEVRWLTAAAAAGDNLGPLLQLLDKAAGNSEPFYAWILDANGDVLEQNPTARRLQTTPVLTSTGSLLLHKKATAALQRGRQEFVFIPEVSEASVASLEFFRCTEQGTTLLCLSRVPNVTGDLSRDRDLIAGLCQKLKTVTVPSTVESLMNSTDELDLIRDMLTLRTLTDEDFSSPQMLLQEFLIRLADLTGFERASVYMSSCGDTSQLELLATGGIAVAGRENDDWTMQEGRILDMQRANPTGSNWQETPRSCDGFHLESHLFVRERVPGKSNTVIVLSSRSRVTYSSIKIELAKWSAQFLPQTFEKAMVRLQNEERARRDGLTRLANRQTFDTELHKAIRGCIANRLPCSLLLIDLDHFKSINDTHGHLAGDAVLQAVAATISQTVQQTRIADRGLVARYGGEEFAVLLPEISLAGAQRIAEQIRQTVAARGHLFENTRLNVTTSIGVAAMPLQGNSSVTLLHAADKALYAAKHAGRNKVSVAPLNVTQLALSGQ
ncbi:diguanylate cyclase [Planctomicrobium sp. SH661]|uniref:GGDEF domain-containing protein n=1 Tax=Planctomicrobium sp. SH661 TaxID=3448124 RepID=UPI003F5B5E31